MLILKMNIHDHAIQMEYDPVKVKQNIFLYPTGPANDQQKYEIKLPMYEWWPKEELLQIIYEFKKHAAILGWWTSGSLNAPTVNLLKRDSLGNM